MSEGNVEVLRPDSGKPALVENSRWYQEAVVYQVHIRAFFDSNADGIGDFKGLTSQLDYIQGLGVTAVWLLPFYPSPLRDDGYDIADYRGINPIYGTLRDFKEFLREAHRRGIRVITELVLNHTSDQHEWFQKARRAPSGSPERDFYVWSDDPAKYKDARIIFKDFETSNWAWDPVAKAYYWHRFYSSQPDLNFENPKVQKAMVDIVDFWLDMGVDGLRLDAVPYLFEKEGTNCENLPETHEFLRKLRAHVDAKYKDRMLLAEANQWPEDAAAYFGNGDECHMCFHFPLMPRMFMAVRMEDRFPIIDILEQTPALPKDCQWTTFLRNHDELTLEMVTDEERDYMYRMYASDDRARINLGIRRRLAPLLDNDRRRIELLNGLLFALPGTPVIYYGDEIGMGDNIYLGDRNGVRTPFQWSADKNAGFSRTNPQQLFLPVVIDYEYHYESVNVESRQRNPHSLLWWMKKLISLRRESPALQRGTLEVLHPENRKVLCFIRKHEAETILVVANLSRFTQCVELDLSAYKGLVLTERFGGTSFPAVSERPYFLTLGPHAFHWFSLSERGPESDWLPISERKIAQVRVTGYWEELFGDAGKGRLEKALHEYLRSSRWFSGKSRTLRAIRVEGSHRFTHAGGVSYLLVLAVEYEAGEPERYVLPISFVAGYESFRLRGQFGAQSMLCDLVDADGQTTGVLYDATCDERFGAIILETVLQRRTLKSRSATLKGMLVSPSKPGKNGSGEHVPRPLGLEQSNSTIVFGKKYVFKLIRKLDPGLSPELEVGLFFSRLKRELPAAPMVGALEYLAPNSEPCTIGILQEYVQNEGGAWNYVLDALGRFFESALARDQAGQSVGDQTRELVAELLPAMELLGRRAGEMHLALAAIPDDAVFGLEPVSDNYQRSLYQSMRGQVRDTITLLRKVSGRLPAQHADLVAKVLALEPRIQEELREIYRHRISAMRLRVHGDFHLGQVLFTGKDFVVIDFEGEPSRPLSERKFKRSAYKDIAGMLSSFKYVASAALYQQRVGSNEMQALRSWRAAWVETVSSTFMKGYYERCEGMAFIPRTEKERQILLRFNLIEKMFYELRYDLNYRPEWAHIPLEAMLELIGG